MAKANKTTMSYEELKSKLQQRFQNQGIFNEMRAQMRSKLVQELYQTVELSSRECPDGEERGMLQEQVSNWLIYDHLQRRNYEFTLSTFLQESGAIRSPKTILGIRDVFFLLGISEDPTAHWEPNERGDRPSFLFAVVKSAIEMQVRSSRNKASTQTWREQLHLIDETFEKQKETQQQEDSYQKVMKEVEQLRAYIDRELEEKTRILERRAFRDDENRKEISNETVNYDYTVKEDEARRKLETKEQQLQDCEDKLKTMANRLEEQAVHKNVQTQSSRDVNKNGNLREINLKMDFLVGQLDILEKEKRLPQKSLEEMADYKAMKSELSFSKREAQRCVERLEAAQKEWQSAKEKLEQTIADLTLKLSNPCSDLLRAHQEMQKLQDAYKLDRAVWNKQQNDLERHLDETKQLYQRALLRNEHQRSQLEAQEQTIKTLRQQFHEVETSFLEMNHTPMMANVTNPAISAGHFSLPAANYPTNHFQIPTPAMYESFVPPDFVLEANQRIAKMQAESEQLEKRYRDFVENELLGRSIHPLRRIPFSSTPNINHYAGYNPTSVPRPTKYQPAFNYPTEALSFREPNRPRSDEYFHLRYRDVSERDYVQTEKLRINQRLSDPRLRSSMPGLSKSFLDQDVVDVQKQHSLNTFGNKQQVDPDLGREFPLERTDVPHVKVSGTGGSLSAISSKQSEDKTRPKIQHNSKTERNNSNQSTLENASDSAVSSETQNDNLPSKNSQLECPNVAEISMQHIPNVLESMYLKSEAGDSLNQSPVTSFRDVTANGDDVNRTASEKPELPLPTAHNLSKLELPKLDCVLDKGASNSGKDTPPLGNAEAVQADDIQNEMLAPAEFQPSTHSTPVQEQKLQEVGEDPTQKEDSQADQSDGNLQISIGEQISNGKSDDSFW